MTTWFNWRTIGYSTINLLLIWQLSKVSIILEWNTWAILILRKSLIMEVAMLFLLSWRWKKLLYFSNIDRPSKLSLWQSIDSGSSIQPAYFIQEWLLVWLQGIKWIIKTVGVWSISLKLVFRSSWHNTIALIFIANTV